MTAPALDLLCLGNAIVDVLATVDDAFLAEREIAKGGMNLIDEARAESLYAAMGRTLVVSGGSAANTAVGAAKLGAAAAFVGKVRDDEVGGHFSRDLRSTGVAFATAPATDGPATARSYILVTPDGQRTMNTHLGACQNLTSADVDPALVASAGITYLEGYLWDPPHAKDAFRKASELAHAAGRRVALSLSDSFCVGRYRDEFLDLIRSKKVDIVFSNEDELLALYETREFDAAVAALGAECGLAAVTRGAEGAVVVETGRVRAVPASPVEAVVDSTGAGRPLRRGLPGGVGAGPRRRRLRPSRRTGGGRDHRPRRRAARGRPRRPGPTGGLRGLNRHTASIRPGRDLISAAVSNGFSHSGTSP